MTQIPGTVINSRIVPDDTQSNYATHDAQYGRDGWRSVADLTERDAIYSPRRKEGMIVWVVSEGKAYQLIGGIDNANWQLFETASAIADLTDVNVTGVVNGQTLKYLDGTWYPAPDITGAAPATWGAILGTLSDQTDLNNRFLSIENNYATKANPISGAYNNVIVNSEGIVISGGNASYAVGEVESVDVGTLGYTSNAAAFGSITSSTTISGSSSGATAQVRSVGTTSSGTMTLVSIVGNFQVGESVVLSSAPTKPITVTSFDKKLNTLQVVRNSTNNRDVTLYSAPTGLVNWISSQSTTPNMVFWLGQNADAHFLSRGFNADLIIEKDFANSLNTTNQVRLGWEGSSASLSVGGSQVFGIAGTGIVTHSRQSQFDNTIDQRVSSTTVSRRAVLSSGATPVAVTTDYDALAYGTNRGTLKYLLQLDDGTNVRSSEIIATYSGSTVNWNEFAINEVGSAITGASWSVVTSGANLVLRLTVTSGSYNIRISRESLI